MRNKFYDTRPKCFIDLWKKTGHKSFSVSIDLIKRRYLLMRELWELIKSNNDIDFPFVKINCSLGFKHKNGLFRYFNSENKLHNLINK